MASPPHPEERGSEFSDAPWSRRAFGAPHRAESPTAAGAPKRASGTRVTFNRRSRGRRRPHNGGRRCKARLPAAAVRIPPHRVTRRPVPQRSALRHRPRAAALGTQVRVHRPAHRLRRAHRIPARKLPAHRLPARRPALAARNRARRLARARRPDQAPHTALGRSVAVARPHIDLRRSDIDAARRNVDRIPAIDRRRKPATTTAPQPPAQWIDLLFYTL